MSLRLLTIHICGASILSVTRGLTAAHCFNPRSRPGDYSILAGSTLISGDFGSEERVVRRFITHPQYDKSTHNNNIAVLWFDIALPLGPRISPIRVPFPNAQLPVGSVAGISGW